MKRYIRSAVTNPVDEDWDVQRVIARDPDTTPRVLEMLSNSSDNETLVQVSVHPNTPIDILRKFATGNKLFLQRSMANCQHTPPEVLTLLINVKDSYVWSKLASNPNTPTEVLSALHYEQPEDIAFRYVDEYLADNENTPEDVLIDIAANCDPNAARIVAESANSETAIRTIYERFNESASILEYVAKNPHTPEDIIEELATSNYYFVRCAIADRTDVSPELLARLAEDPTSDVLSNVLQNPSTPIETIKKLIADPKYKHLWQERWIRAALLQRGIKIPKEAQS